jgi:putative ABC transport system permease protein
MVSIARHSLFQDLPRFLVAEAGIIFAVSLVSIQTGLLDGFTQSTSLLVDHSEADIWVASKDMQHLDLTLPLPFQRLGQAQKVEGVDRAEAVIIAGSLWRKPSGQVVPIRVIGFDPDAQLFKPWSIQEGNLSQLQQPYKIMLNESDLSKLDINGVNAVGKVGSIPSQVVGMTTKIQSVVSSAFVFTSLQNAAVYTNPVLNTPDRQAPASPPALTASSPIAFILIRAQPDESLELLKERLEDALPETRAYTTAEMSALTQTYWLRSTSVGFILGLGAVVGIIVGMVIVGQILYSSVSDHLKEFGTLKAMGAPSWFIYRIILEQSLWMSLLGYLPGIGLCLALGAWTLETQAIAIVISPLTATGIFAVTVIMCVGAAVFAIQKVTRLDPAIVFKA